MLLLLQTNMVRSTVTAGTITYSGQAVTVNATTMIQVVAAVITYVPRAVVVTITGSALVSRAIKNLRIQRWAANWRRINRGR